MPFFTVYVLKSYWDLGPLLCDLWLSVDYTVCLVSQYTVLLITIDRYCSVKIAAKYRGWRTQTKVLWMVTITWIIPACLFFTSIFGWEHFVGYRDLLPGECHVQFLKDPVFNTALIIGYYWTTLIVLFILYGGIYKTAYDMQKRSEAKQRKMQSMVALSAGAMTGMAGRAAGIGIAKSQSPMINQDGDARKVTTVVTPSSLPPSNMTSSSSSNQVTEPTTRKTSVPKASGKIDGKATANVSGHTNSSDKKRSNAKKEATNEGDKSERSSSPAFDSDEDCASTTANSQQKALQEAKKRTSLAGLFVHAQAPMLAARSNGQIKTSSAKDNQTMTTTKTTAITTTAAKKSPKIDALPKITESSLLDSDNIVGIDASIQMIPLQPTPVQSPISPKDIEPPSCPTNENAQIKLSHEILPPPDGFQSSPASIRSASSRSERPSSLVVSNASELTMTYDILGGLDGADLRFMDESSVVVSSPTNESPPTSIVLPPHNTSPARAANANVTNPSLLQKALIKATAHQQQPKVLLKSSMELHSPTSTSRDVNASTMASSTTQQMTMAVMHTSSETISKFNTAVSVTERPDRPITSIVKSSSGRSNLDDAVERQQSDERVQMSSAENSIYSKTTMLPQPSIDVTTVNATIERSIISIIPTTASAISQPAVVEKESKKRDFIRSIGKRLKGRKKIPIGGRQKSKSENRARKAFRTISFILGAFVLCWTPYHVLALVEGFCSCMNVHLYLFSYFLCYANSPINPFCYAMANQQFKKTFTRILRGDLHMT